MSQILFLKAVDKHDASTTDMFGTHVEMRTRKDGVTQQYHVSTDAPQPGHPKGRPPVTAEPGLTRKPEAPAHLTDAPQFKRWFSNSKVVDRAGKPLVVYHATRADFHEFDLPKADIGIHFGSAKQANKRLELTARSRGTEGQHVMPVYLSIQNPLRTEDVFSASAGGASSMIGQLKKLGIITQDKVVQLMKRSIDPTPDDLAKLNRELIEIIHGAGYDGVVYENKSEGRGDSWAVFSPEQIKSATGNDGQFDSDNPNITKSILFLSQE